MTKNNWIKKMDRVNRPLPYNVLPQTGGKIFVHSHLSFTAAYSLKSERDWPVDFAKL